MVTLNCHICFREHFFPMRLFLQDSKITTQIFLHVTQCKYSLVDNSSQWVVINLCLHCRYSGVHFIQINNLYYIRRCCKEQNSCGKLCFNLVPRSILVKTWAFMSNLMKYIKVSSPFPITSIFIYFELIYYDHNGRRSKTSELIILKFILDFNNGTS